MRHGEAKSTNDSIEPELTANGKNQVSKVASYSANKNVSFTQVHHSRKKRARQTAEIMINKLIPGLVPHEHNKISPNDDPAIITAEIDLWDEDTLITSHLPFIPDLFSSLTGRDAYSSSISFEPATLICLEKIKNSEWELKWFISPSAI